MLLWAALSLPFDIPRRSVSGITADSLLVAAGLFQLAISRITAKRSKRRGLYIAVRTNRGASVMQTIATWLSYPARRTLARVLPVGGYGTCGRCNLPWYAGYPHDTEYMERTACFALCGSCWRELATPEARLPYYQYLVFTVWKEPHAWPIIRDAVRDGK